MQISLLVDSLASTAILQYGGRTPFLKFYIILNYALNLTISIVHFTTWLPAQFINFKSI